MVDEKEKKKSRVNGGTGSNGSKLPPLPLQSTFTLFSKEGEDVMAALKKLENNEQRSSIAASVLKIIVTEIYHSMKIDCTICIC